MYGLVNKAVQDLVCSEFGEDAWKDIVELSGLEVGRFVSMTNYDDEVTYKLVNAAAERLGLTAEQVLEAFGRYWTKFTVREGYGELIRRSGATVEEFLAELDNMHTRVALSFPELRPPSFELERTDAGLMLHYRSEREGLAPMVVGLLEGLGSHFDEEVEVEQVEHRAEHGHDVFRLRIQKIEPA